MQTKPKSVKKTELAEPSIVKGGSNPKGVIYIDQDSDITSIASKIRQVGDKDIKIVVPKNSAALKSGVNLKLLARTAHNKAKNVVFITSDSKLISMASAAKLSTAPNLSAEPTLHTPNLKINNLNNDEEFGEMDEPIKSTDGQKLDDEDLTIEGAELGSASYDPKLNSSNSLDKGGREDNNRLTKKDKKAGLGKKIPNFYDFRKKALIGLGVFFLIFLFIFLFLGSKSKAVIEVRANAERVDVNFVAKLNESAVNSTEGELKVDRKSGSKAITESVPATGQQNIGSKASGKLNIFNCTDDSITIPAGTGVSAPGLTYFTNSAVTVSASDFFSNGTCKKNGKASVNVTAQNAGEQYNAGVKEYSIAGQPLSVTAQGTGMTGGTTQNVKVVSSADVDTLKTKLATSNEAAYKDELRDQIADDQKALEDTFSVQLGNIQLSPAVGQQADQLSGTVTANYSMLAVNQTELKKLLNLQVEKLKKSQNQSIIKDGFDTLKLTIAEDAGYQFATTAYLGPNIDQEKIKDEVAGKKKGEAIAAVNKFEGVDSTKVKINPFWVSRLPGRDKIEVKIEVNESSN